MFCFPDSTTVMVRLFFSAGGSSLSLHYSHKKDEDIIEQQYSECVEGLGRGEKGRRK